MAALLVAVTFSVPAAVLTRFMAETASILCPDKKILVPDLDAGCSLADMIAPEPDPETLLGLGRAQRFAIARARQLGRKRVELLLRGGRRVEATFPAGLIVLNEK